MSKLHRVVYISLWRS